MFKLLIYDIVGTEQYIEIKNSCALKYFAIYDDTVKGSGMHIINKNTNYKWIPIADSFESFLRVIE